MMQYILCKYLYQNMHCEEIYKHYLNPIVHYLKAMVLFQIHQAQHLKSFLASVQLWDHLTLLLNLYQYLWKLMIFSFWKMYFQYLSYVLFILQYLEGLQLKNQHLLINFRINRYQEFHRNIIYQALKHFLDISLFQLLSFQILTLQFLHRLNQYHRSLR